MLSAQFAILRKELSMERMLTKSSISCYLLSYPSFSTLESKAIPRITRKWSTGYSIPALHYLRLREPSSSMRRPSRSSILTPSAFFLNFDSFIELNYDLFKFGYVLCRVPYWFFAVVVWLLCQFQITNYKICCLFLHFWIVFLSKIRYARQASHTTSQYIRIIEICTHQPHLEHHSYSLYFTFSLPPISMADLINPPLFILLEKLRFISTQTVWKQCLS